MKLTFTSLLALVFITLKLVGYVDWSWLWVLAPIWVEWLLTGVLVSVVVSLRGK